MDTELKRRNELDVLECVKWIHDDELSQCNPDNELMALCQRFVKLVEDRHRREDSRQSSPSTVS